LSPTVANWREGLLQQWRVVDALLYRELRTRVGGVRFGFLGVLAEPVITVGVFLALFAFLRAGRGGTLDVVLFLACGITGIYIFTRIATRSINAMEANEALLFYRRVRPIDAVIARAVVEFCLMVICLVIFTLFRWLLLEHVVISNPFDITLALILLGLLSFGFGLFAMVAGFRYSAAKYVVIAITRPLFLMSGVFYSLQNIPPQWRPWLSWNPILQAIELMRHGFSSSYVIEGISMPYLALCSLLACWLGLWIYSNNEPLLMRK
jgi:capsular polysaccharide transport system permease protein